MTAELQQLGTQLETIHALFPETVLLGSLGRAAIMQEELPVRRADGSLRDIDALRVGHNDHEDKPYDAIDGPFIVDDVFHEWIKFGENTSWLVCPYATNIQEEVPNELFAIQQHTFAGTVAQTFNVHTQLQIQCMMERLRPKDVEPLAKFSAFAASQPNPLPEEAYEAFVRFRAAVAARNQKRGLQFVEKSSGLLLACIPEQVKSALRPCFRRASHKIINFASR